MFCVKCGAKLKQGSCPSCGFVDNTIVGGSDQAVGSPTEPNKKRTRVKKTKGKKVREKRPNGVRLKTLLAKKQSSEKQPSEKRMPKKKSKKIIIIIAATAVVVLGVGAFLTIYLIKDARYEEAINYLERDKPKLAAQEFEELKSFKESEQYLEDANTLIAYYAAVDAYESQEYENALGQFEGLGSYEDSKEYAQLCQNYIDYNSANAFFDSDNFEQAKVVFIALGDFEDSINMATSCQNNMDYNKATSLFDALDFEGAKRLFIGIPEFKDSNDMVFICERLIEYEDAMDSYSKGNYAAAARMFQELEYRVQDSNVDISSILTVKQLKYQQGQCYYKQELFFSAYKAFTAATDYEDAMTMAGKCKKPFETKELYINPAYTKNSVKFTYYGKDAAKDACVKIYDGSTLVSICLIKKGEKLKIYLPSGTFDMEVSYGYSWYGENEAFGTSPSKYYSDKLSSSYYYWIDL